MNVPRAEGGVYQFGSDWPGVFMRGDTAVPMGMTLLHVLDDIKAGRQPSVFQLAMLDGLAQDLVSADVASDMKAHPDRVMRLNAFNTCKVPVLKGRGPGVGLLSGTMWYPFDPRPEDVHRADFPALANQCRWGGHVHNWMSVAEHCVRTAWVLMGMSAPKHVCLQALVHDLHEYVPPHDQPGPILRGNHPWSQALDAMEHAAMVCFRTALGLPVEFDPRVREADLCMLATEADQIGPLVDPKHFAGLPPPSDVHIHPWSPAEAWKTWSELFEELGGVWPA